jgi:hypothetical protein
MMHYLCRLGCLGQISIARIERRHVSAEEVVLPAKLFATSEPLDSPSGPDVAFLGIESNPDPDSKIKISGFIRK